MGALEDWVMRMEGAALTAEQRIALAEYLTGRRFENAGLPEEAFCASPGPTLDAARISWTGFAGNLQGTGYQGAEKAGLTADEIPGLELRWGFAFPGATQSRGSPTVVGEAGQFGEVLALDTRTGCAHWAFTADAQVRGAIAVADHPETGVTAWFVDNRSNAYALDAESGEPIWKVRVGWHATSSASGSVALHAGRLSVPATVGGEALTRPNSPAFAVASSQPHASTRARDAALLALAYGLGMRTAEITSATVAPTARFQGVRVALRVTREGLFPAHSL